MEDPYKLLGVERTASDEAIRGAYRKLAKRHHPDLNPGKKEAEERFKAISGAYELLSDKEKRARFDRGEIDASGAERPQARRFYRDFGDAGGRDKYHAQSFSPDDLESIFGAAFRDRFGHGFAARGADAHYALVVDFLEAALGGVRRLALPDGRTLDVTIPAGLKDGQVLRLKGQGLPGTGEAPPGDALIEVSVAPHPLFRREGDDVVIELPVTLKEAVLGAKVAVPTIKGPVTLAIPPNSSSGSRLRLKGRGILGAHQYVVLKLVLPHEAEPELADFLRGWQPRHPFDPRKGMRTT
ncbi:MAG TPA: J domain-containing protein [Alphaproteobacteria bacterium]|nr:J domain-containing protein [Alphaproteobacteria bacterium]